MSRYSVLALLLPTLSLALPALAHAQVKVRPAECSPWIANNACTVTIQRDSPSSPLPIRMNRGQTVTIIVAKRPLDKIKVETTSKDVAPQDFSKAIADAIMPSLSGLTSNTRTLFSVTDLKTAMGTLAVDQSDPDPMKKALDWIAAQHTAVKSIVENVELQLKDATKKTEEYQDIKTRDWVKERDLKSRTEALKGVVTSAVNREIPGGVIEGLRANLGEVRKLYAALATRTTAISPSDLADVNTKLNAVTVTQVKLDEQLTALRASQAGLFRVSKLIDKVLEDGADKALEQEFEIESGSDRNSHTSEMAMVVLEQLSEKESKLGTVTGTWATTRWETSLGVLVSPLRVRSFAAGPKFVDGKAVLTADNKLETFISETKSHPMVVPMAFVHLRALEWALKQQRLAVLATGGIGVNPHSRSADFAWGGTLSYGRVYVSLLKHRTNDIRLANDLVRGQSLGPAPAPAPATERFVTWKPWTVSLSVKVF